MPARPTRTYPSSGLLLAFTAHVIATFIHFAHNAVYLHDYPNLPKWITTAGVYGSWGVLTAMGVVGLLVLRFVSAKAGLGVLALYAVLGFGGLDHYTLAAINAHTLAMNLTILGESVTASVLLIVVACEFLKLRRYA